MTLAIPPFRLPMLLAALALGPVAGAAQGTPPTRGGTPPARGSTARGAAPTAASEAAQRRANLLDPTRAYWKTRAPDTVRATFETSRGPFVVELIRAWAPNGVDRVYNLARAGYFDDSRFYRVLYAFVAQFGLAGDPVVARTWTRQTIRADSVRERNARGTIAFAQRGPATRTTDLFINLRDNTTLDTLGGGFAPIGRVVEGMAVVDSLHSGYGEVPAMAAPIGNPTRLYGESNKYLDEAFPKLDRIIRVTVAPPSSKPDSTRRRP